MPTKTVSPGDGGPPLGQEARDAAASWKQGRVFALSFAPGQVRQRRGKTLVADSVSGLEGEVNKARVVSADDVGALVLTGRGGLTVPHDKSLAFRREDSFSVAVWACCTCAESGWQTVAAKSPTEGADYGLWVGDDDSWCFGGPDNLCGGRVAEAWQHVVAVQDGGEPERRLYVDGELVGLTSNTSAGDAVGPLVVGYHGSKREFFHGLVSEVNIWRRALSEEEVKALYAATGGPERSRLVEAAGADAGETVEEDVESTPGGRLSHLGIDAEPRPDGVGERSEGTKSRRPRRRSTVAKKRREVLLEDVVEEFRTGTVDGVDEWMFAGPNILFYLHCLQAHAAGWREMDLATIVATSGAAGLFGYERGSYMPKYAFHAVNPDDQVAEATGFGYEHLKFNSPEEAWQMLKESIDTGRPLKAPDWEGILYVGYREASKPANRKVFGLSNEPDDVCEWLTWAKYEDWAKRVISWGQNGLIGRHTQRIRPAAARKTAVRVMSDLVKYSTRAPGNWAEQNPKAIWGLAGIEAYADDCANPRNFPRFDMCHPINPQWATRRCVAVYLGRTAKTPAFPQKVSKHIRAASVSYFAAYHSWVVAHYQIGWGAIGVEKTKTHRRAAAEAIRQAAAHEKAAIAAVKRALKAAGA